MFGSWLFLCSVPSALLVSKIVNYCKTLVWSTACYVYVWLSFKNKVANQLSLMLFLLPSQSEAHKAHWGIKQWRPTYKRPRLKRPQLYDSSKVTPTNEIALYCRLTVGFHGIHSERYFDLYFYMMMSESGKDVCVCVHVHVSLFQCMCLCLCAYMWVCFRVCVCVHVSLFQCVCVFVLVSLF